MILDALEGYEAPGELTQRPSDTRFKDNPLDNDRLGKIQDSFYGFLVKKEVSSTSRYAGPPPSDKLVSSLRRSKCNLTPSE